MHELAEGRNPAHIARHIQFENKPAAPGSQYLKPLLRAIRNRTEAEVRYNAYSSGTKSFATLRPLLLKQYQGRWYVLSMNREGFKIVYALDRMEGDIKVTRNKFQYNEEESPADFFKHAIGVIVPREKPVRVTLSFTLWQGLYVKTLPLHASQEVLEDNDKEFRIAITVHITYELITEILRHRTGVKVISPKSLAKQVVSELKKIERNYKIRSVRK
jgi:predicted DNA-binding transcriptional regulator YafY